MTPLLFTCEAELPMTPDEIARQILDVRCWPEFRGYGSLPGIRAAELEQLTPDIVGSRIRVTNDDGSTHVEEIIEWQPPFRLSLRLHDFSAPLSYLATEFQETWQFHPADHLTRVMRSLELHPRTFLSRLPLRLIALLLKKAIQRHLQQMAHFGGSGATRASRI